MDDTPPLLYLLYGDDDLEIEETIDQIRSRLGDSTTADMNTQRFEAPGVSLNELQQALLAAPFLAPRRLTILEQGQKLTKGHPIRDQLDPMLEGLPPTTALVVVDRLDTSRKRDLDRYHQNSKFYRWAQDHPQQSYVRLCARRHGGSFIAWLKLRAAKHGGEIETQAAQLLAESVADNAPLADQELCKLLDYVDRSRPIEIEDVEKLTPFEGQSDVFAMVDALGEKKRRKAMGHLRHLLTEHDPRFAMAMIQRQIRLILLAQEAPDRGKDLAKFLGVPGFVAGKVSQQASNFQAAELEALYQELMRIDLASKTGQGDLAVELDLLLFENTR